MKLLIRNLARTTTEADLQKIFEAYGKVQSCKLVIDKDSGESKGFGFIEMPRPGDAKAAIKNLNGKDVDGSKIRVKKAEPKHENKEHVQKDIHISNTTSGTGSQEKISTNVAFSWSNAATVKKAATKETKIDVDKNESGIKRTD